MTRRTGMLPGWTGRAGIAGVCARITGSAIGMRAHTTRAVRRMSIPPEAIQAMFRAADLIPLDPGRRRLVGRGRLVATLLVIAFYSNPSRVSGQEHAVAVVGGVAATGTSAEQQTLPVARIEAVTPRFFFHDGWNIRGVGDAGWQPLSGDASDQRASPASWARTASATGRRSSKVESMSAGSRRWWTRTWDCD